MKPFQIIFFALSLIAANIARAQQRIVSLNGTVSEMLCALGLEQQIVGVDVTSTYPASIQQKPKVGHNRNISAEGVLSLRPTLVIGIPEEIKPELVEQLKAAKVTVQLVKQTYSPEGTRQLLLELAGLTSTMEKGKQLLADFNKRLATIPLTHLDKRVLFVYARGTGSMTVCGKGTSPAAMIELSGATNAMAELNEFKPLSAESLVASNPDVILLFDSGLQSVGGIEGMLKVPGVSMTNAGKNRKIISMNGHLFAGFGLQLPEGLQELRKKISG